MIRQIEYKGHTLLLFRLHGPDAGEQEASARWIIVAQTRSTCLVGLRRQRRTPGRWLTDWLGHNQIW